MFRMKPRTKSQLPAEPSELNGFADQLTLLSKGCLFFLLLTLLTGFPL